MQIKKQQLEPDWFQIGKGVCESYILSPCLFNFYVEYTWEMPGWMKHKLESRWQGEISITSDMEMTFSWTPKSLLMVTAAMKFKDTCSLEEKLRPT